MQRAMRREMQWSGVRFRFTGKLYEDYSHVTRTPYLHVSQIGSGFAGCDVSWGFAG